MSEVRKVLGSLLLLVLLGIAAAGNFGFPWPF